MKKTAKRGISLLIAMVMLLGVVMPAGAVWTEEPLQPETPVWEDWPEMEVNGNDFLPDGQQQAETLAAGEYEIYPTPQTITYANPAATVTLPATMQVVYSEGIDEYTKARAVEAFQAGGVTLVETETAGAKLRVGIQGKSDAVNTYFASHTPATTGLFTKNDSYQLLINADGVAVLGKDTDAAFYGLTTVKRIMEQVTDKQVKQLTVEDWSDVAFRGFIEGYYGNPWSVEDRCELMKFGGEMKMNIYFYAPKDDPKHSTKWRELYTPEEIETKIKPLAQAGNESKCYYGFALHPFWADAINFSDDTAYAADLEVLKAKFEQVIQAGVRQIAVLADDRSEPSVGSAKSYVRLLNDLTDWLKSTEMQSKYPGLKTSVPFCPNAYMGTGDTAQVKVLAPTGVGSGMITGNVPIIMTGGAIWGHVSSTFVDAFYKNVGVGPYYWVNWPCSDNSKGSLTMGAQDIILERGVDPSKIQGIMLNPMQQSEPSKQAIFCNADYAWNIWTEDAQATQAWEDSFKYVDHVSAAETETSTALRELSKHMIHQNKNVNNNYPESVELAPKLTAFQDKMNAGTLTTADVDAMKTEFQTLKDAATLYKNKTTGNTRILGKRNADGSYPQGEEQMAPWLDCWEDFAQANLDLLEALRLSLDNADGSNNNAIVQSYLAGQNALSASQNHSFWYVDHDETAVVGGQRLVPFTNNLLNMVSTTAKTILDPTVLVETIITNRTDTPEGGLEAMRDGDVSTIAVFKNPNSIAVGTYMGVQYNRAITLNAVRIEVGAANADDRFNGSKLQYLSEDNVWTDIPGATFTHSDATLSATGLDLQAKGVRVIATEERTGTWLGIKEIFLNDEQEPVENPVETYTGVTASLSSNWIVASGHGAVSDITDGKASSIAKLKNASGADNCPAGAYIELDLGSEKGIGTVSLVGDSSATGDCMANAKIQYKSGNDWVDAATDITTGDFSINLSSQNITTRYLRVVNTTQVAVWVRIGEISVTEPHVENHIDEIGYQSETVKSLVDPIGTLTDNSATLSASGVILKPGEFVGIALPEVRRIVDIVADYTHNPNIVLKVGMNEQEMEVVDLSQTASLMAAGRAVEERIARYVRLENVGTQTASFILNELSVQSEGITGIHLDSSTMANRDTAQDARSLHNEGNWFDGEITTSAKYCDTQDNGEDVVYDLGQTRSISNIKAYVRDSETDYVRHGKIQVSMDKTNWTDVVDLTGTGAIDEAATTAQKAGWTGSSTYPNYVYKEGTLTTPVDARYLRVVFTGSFGLKWLVFNEIVINDGEYVSVDDNPAFTASPKEGAADFVPSHLTDGDLTTAFKPGAAGAGSISYRLSDFTSVGQINILGDSAAVGAAVSVRTDASTWKTLSTRLGDGLTEVAVPEDVANVLEVKISWTSGTPTFYELIPVERDQVAASGGQTSSDTETVPINSYSGSDTTINFDENWKFNLGDDSGASALVYNDASWRTVDLPHDFSIEGEFTASGEAESGYLTGGVGWYRKSFTVDPSWADKTVSIYFGGAYMDTEVYLNGTKLGEHHYGYTPFSFVLSNLNTSGENVIAVKTDGAFPSSRWYSGAGLYRSVHLTVSDKVHVAQFGTKVETPAGSNGQPSGTVKVTTTVQNDGSAAANVIVKQEIFALDANFQPTGEAVATATTSSATNVTAGGTAAVDQELTVASPKLWNSWDKGDPNLYQLKTTVLNGSTVLDTYTTEFGFRAFEFTVDTGFKLNGVNVKLKGVCQHHDQGALGAEAWYRALERQVEILQEMGCNAIRVTHNPAADELIEICNRKGMLIIDEAFDGWAWYKNGNSNDFARWFNTQIASDNHLVGKESGDTWAKFILQTMIRRDMNNPCVIMYSLGNEVQEGSGGYPANSDNYVVIARQLIEWAQAVDTVIPVTRGANDRATGSDQGGQINALIAEKGGVVGFNYDNNGGAITTAHNKGWKMYGSETASSVNSRGIYSNKFNAGNSHTTQSGTGPQDRGIDRLTSYDVSRVGWGATASQAWWATIQYDYSAGEFVWTGFDYIGEPTPWNGLAPGKVGTAWPKNSFFGIIDTNGIPKDSYYLYRAMWNESDTTLHVLPTWDEVDVVKDSSGKVEVVVYSNAPKIKVFLNGTQVGAAKATETATPAGHKYRTFSADTMTGTNTFAAGSGSTSLYATFNVPYAAGTLEVKAYDASGNEITNTVGRDVVKTTSGASKLRVTADRATIKNDGRDLSYITIDITDASGNIVNGALNEITVNVTGDGVFMGMDNGVQCDHTSYLSKTRAAGAGQLVAIVQSTKKAGKFTLTATADGLTPASVEVTTSGVAQGGDNQTPASYDIAKNYYVQLNTEPELPTKAVVTMTDGSTVEKDVTWSTYDAGQLGTVGNSFAISGVIDQGGLNIPVSVSVTVLDTVAALLNYSTAVQVGAVTANLPTSRPAVMADGAVLTAQFPVTWEAEPSYAQEGVYVVGGTADVFGETMRVTATVRVSAGEAIEGSDVMGAVSSQANGFTINGVDKTGGTELDALRDDNTTTAAVTLEANGVLNFFYDTAQNFYKVKVTYVGAVPAEGQVTLTPAAVSQTVSGQTVTYELGGIQSNTDMNLRFTPAVQIAEIELINATPSFTVNSTAELDDLQLGGQSATAAQLAAKEITTPSTMVNITPVSSRNVSVTILPETDNVILLVTESEDHTERALYTIRLGFQGVDAADDSRDYTGTVTPYAPSEQGTGNDGPDDNVVDGNIDTYWHSKWGDGGTRGHTGAISNRATYGENYIQLTLADPTEIVALRHFPRKDMSNGRISDYQIRVSATELADDAAWLALPTVAEGTFANEAAWQVAPFDAVTAKYVRLYATGSYGNQVNVDMAVAELRVVKALSGTDISSAVVTVTPAQQYWTNEPVEPTNITVTTLSGETLTEGTDYTLRFANNVEPGTADVYVDGMGGYYGTAHGTFTIVKVDTEITGFDAVTVSTREGTAPVLPETVTAQTNIPNLTIQEPVTWDAISADKYQNVDAANKTFTVQGTVEGTDIKPTATVTVALAQTVDSVSAVTIQGIAPSLPATVTVHFDDGTQAACPVTWELDGVSFDTVSDTPVTVTGTISGLRVSVQANVRVSDAVPSDMNFAVNTAGTGIPFAMAYVSSPSDNPYKAINGSRSAATNSDKVIWCDWESGVYHEAPWLAVALAGTLEGSDETAKTYIPANKFVNKVKIGFLEEDGSGAHKVCLPSGYKVEYYTGPTSGLVFNTHKTATGESSGNAFVRGWTDSPLLNNDNWTEVTAVGTKPAVPANQAAAKSNWVTYEFEPVSTCIIRVVLTPKTEQWVGIDELEVYGLEVPVPNSDFEVTSIAVDGVNRLNDFDANKNLSIVLTADAPIPAVTAQATKNASVSVTPAAAVPGDAVITITSEDGSTTETYTIHFTRAPIIPGQHTITLTGSKGVTLSATSAVAGTTVTVTAKEGYLLARVIVTAKSGESVAVSNNSFVMPDSDVTVNVSAPAIPYTITYDLDGGEVKTANPTTYNVESEAITLNAPTKSGYNFAGWTGTGLSGAVKDVTIATGSTGDRSYTATWTKKGGDTPVGPGGPGGGIGGGSDNRPVKDTDPDGVVTTTVTDSRTGAVTETVTYPDGEQSVTVTQKDGSSIRTVTRADGSRSVASTVPGEGTTIVVTDEIGEEVARVVLPEVAPGEEKQFTDIPQDHWAADSIGKVAAMGLFVGDEHGNFMGNARMNRGMMATVLHRISGELKKRPAEFVDVHVGAYYAPAVDWASGAGIIKGVGNNRYAPDQDITRQELATMMYRYAKFLGVDVRTQADALANFPDRAELGDWAAEAMNWAVSAGLFQGRGADLAPQGNATRAEVATILSRFVELLK